MLKKEVMMFYEVQSDYFKDEDEIIKFEDISSYFHQETAQFTNGVYEGTKLVLTLYIKNRQKPYVIKIDSNKEEKYKLVYTLSYAIAKYREDEILKNLANKIKIIFKTQKDFELHFWDDKLEVVYIGDKNHYLPFEVKSVKTQKNFITFESENKRNECIYTNTISDVALFLKLISTQSYFKDESQKAHEKDKKLYFIYLGLVFVFGLNGYFEICCMDVEFIEIISKLSQILLGVFILTAPFFYIARKFNAKKIKKEFENLYKDKEKS